MSQNIYDNDAFFNGYATLDRSVKGLNGAPEWPDMQRLLPELTAKRVVDLGCGYGWFCRYARDRGARVIGLDVSEKMLAKARQMTTGEGIDYQRADLDTLTLAPLSVDLAYSSLALHYLENIPALFATLYNALTPGGMLVFSAEHPIYTAPLQQGWKVDEQGQKTWPVSHYQQEGQRVTHWFADGVRKQHRKLSTWITLLIAAGFELTALNEWGPDAQQIAENPALEEEQERPMIFLLSARKPG